MGKKEQWIQLVMVRFEPAHDAYLYRAPRWECHPGELVVVNFGGKRQGTVLMVEDQDMASEYGRERVMDIVKAFGAKWPLLPVMSTVHEYEIEFDEEDWAPEDDEEESDDTVRAD